MHIPSCPDKFCRMFDSDLHCMLTLQTWENPDLDDPIIKLSGDNDPLDVVELGDPIPYGSIVPVRILGARCFKPYVTAGGGCVLE